MCLHRTLILMRDDEGDDGMLLLMLRHESRGAGDTVHPIERVLKL